MNGVWVRFWFNNAPQFPRKPKPNLRNGLLKFGGQSSNKMMPPVPAHLPGYIWARQKGDAGPQAPRRAYCWMVRWRWEWRASTYSPGDWPRRRSPHSGRRGLACWVCPLASQCLLDGGQFPMDTLLLWWPSGGPVTGVEWRARRRPGAGGVGDEGLVVQRGPRLEPLPHRCGGGRLRDGGRHGRGGGHSRPLWLHTTLAKKRTNLENNAGRLYWLVCSLCMFYSAKAQILTSSVEIWG